jgi:NADPH:quinone reductase-like Zn-dependent oxidoreductase
MIKEETQPTAAERMRNLSPDKVDLLMRRLKAMKAPQPQAPQAGPSRRPFNEARDGNFQLVSSGPGALENLGFVAKPRPPLEPDRLEVEVEAACLNFKDISLALGLYPMPADGILPRIGCDAAGRVVAVGSEITNFKVGDEVFFTSSVGTFARYARALEGRTFKKPPNCTFAEASGMGLPFTTVFYSLLVPGRLRRGERILIHCAAGGVGLSAIQCARSIGAEIFATSGTHEKREYLRSIGIKHVMDSRSLAFAEEIMAITHGEGVDVVLNSLPGEAIEAGIGVLRDGGRFLELGKRDLVAGRTLDLAHFSRAITFSAIDIGAYSVADLHPAVSEIRRALEDGSLRPLPTKVYRASEIVNAFRQMTLGTHIGRIAVQLKGEPIHLTPGTSQ